MADRKYKEYVYSKRIKAERALQGITIKEMAKKMGCSIGTYSMLENGFKCPRITEMNKLSEVLGKPVQYFFKLNTEVKKENMQST